MVSPKSPSPAATLPLTLTLLVIPVSTRNIPQHPHTHTHKHADDPTELECLDYLRTYAPPSDLSSSNITKDFLLGNVRLALAARNATSWGRSVPKAVFLNDVLPYAVLSEPRGLPDWGWRQQFHDKLMPLVASMPNASAAAELGVNTLVVSTRPFSAAAGCFCVCASAREREQPTEGISVCPTFEASGSWTSCPCPPLRLSARAVPANAHRPGRGADARKPGLTLTSPCALNPSPRKGRAGGRRGASRVLGGLHSIRVSPVRHRHDTRTPCATWPPDFFVPIKGVVGPG